MDKKFLKEHYLLEFHNQFKRLSNLKEWSFIPNELSEDEGEDNSQENMGQGDEPQGNMPQNDLQNDPNIENPQNDGGIPQNNDLNNPPEGGDMPQDDSMQNSPMNTDMPSPMEDDNQDDGEEIDVTDLTDAQEKLNKKLNIVGKELSNNDNTIDKLMQSLNKIENIIDSNNKKIADLKQEIQKRNPTPLEKMDLRSIETSGPYNIRPNDYWDNKISQDNNYAAFDENNPNSKEKEYVITASDVDKLAPESIDNPFSNEWNIDLNRIFNI